jgi:RNA polymerase sigma-70 factor, ECF subfamily
MKEPVSISDGLLVLQTLEGNNDAFDVLVCRYSNQLLKYIEGILKLSGQSDACHDVLQMVLLKFYQALPMLATNISLKPWLYRVARNYCIDEIRKHKRRPSISLSLFEQELAQQFSLDLLTDTTPLPEDLAEQHDMEQHVQAAIRALPSKFRAIVALRYTQQLNFREIAQHLNMSPATVKTYFHRALPLLRASLILKEEQLQTSLPSSSFS